MPDQVFINCLPDDKPIADEIEKRLKLTGISYYTSPAEPDPNLQKEMVEKIQEIAATKGCMVCIITQKAVTNSLFISNIQLMCETARNARVVVKYPIEEVENDQGIRLFDSQAYQVRKSRRAEEDISAIIQRINQIINPPDRNLWQIISRIISRKALTVLLIAVALMAVVGTVLFNFVHQAPRAAVLPTLTPVLIYVPFSGQSQNAGLRVYAQNVPFNKPTSDPAAEAPFAFKPAHVLMEDNFNNPAFDGSYDGEKWANDYNRLQSALGLAMYQANGVLQVAVASTGEQEGSVDLVSKYMFTLQQMTYLGYRFRLNGYQGVIQENTFVHGNFSYQFNDLPDISMIQFDGLTQKLQTNTSEFTIDSRWHTIEMVSQTDLKIIDLYLDGKKINSLTLTDGQADRWMHAVFSMYSSVTSDWTGLQFDDIIFGGDDPVNPMLQPEQAAYRFTPDTIALQEDFTSALSEGVLNDGSQFVTQSGGTLAFHIPAGQDQKSIKLLFPAGSRNQYNYYATRFRFTSPEDDTWAAWASIYLRVNTKTLDPQLKYMDPNDLFMEAIRHEYTFRGSYGINNSLPWCIYGQNRLPGNWHTLEMMVRPPDGNSKTNTAFFWVDGGLLGEASLQPGPANLPDPNTPMQALIVVDGGNYRQKDLSGEIDDLVIGTISSDKIKE